MCDEAEKYGIKVIVDVIANHTTPTTSAVSQDLICLLYTSPDKR